MHRFYRLSLWILLLLAGGRVGAGEFNPTLNIGDAAPAWKDLPGTDDQRHALDDLKDKRGGGGVHLQ